MSKKMRGVFAHTIPYILDRVYRNVFNFFAHNSTTLNNNFPLPESELICLKVSFSQYFTNDCVFVCLFFQKECKLCWHKQLRNWFRVPCIQSGTGEEFRNWIMGGNEGANRKFVLYIYIHDVCCGVETLQKVLSLVFGCDSFRGII